MSSAFLRSLQFVLLFTGILLTSGWLQADDNTHLNLDGSQYNAYLSLDLIDEHDAEESAVLSQSSSSPHCDNAISVTSAILTLRVKPAYQCIRAPPVNA